MTNLSELDQLIERLGSRMNETTSANNALQEELNRTRKLVEEKELDKIRATKEKDHRIEELERDKMNLLKEKELLENKMNDIAKSLKQLLPGVNLDRR